MSNSYNAPKRTQFNISASSAPLNTAKNSSTASPHRVGNVNTHQRMNSQPKSFGKAVHSDHQSHTNETNGQNGRVGLVRRVWVRKYNGSPTTILVSEDEIVDDLKQLIFNKFPNSIANFCDPPDLILKLDLLARNQSNANSMKQGNLSGSSWPERRRSISPSGNGPTNGIKILEPDQNVWSILDTYFPQGMNMSESLIIETPVNDETETHAVSFSNGINLDKSGGSNKPLRTDNQQGVPIKQQVGTQNSGFQESAQFYHQPKPQYLYQNQNSANNSNLQVRSASPSSLKNSPGPINVNPYRRTQSSPLYSPPIDGSNNSTNSTTGGNSQAILLLPKNFPLTANSSNANTMGHYKKRLSLDDGLINGQRARDHSLRKSLSTIESNTESNDLETRPKLEHFDEHESKKLAFPKLDASNNSSNDSNSEQSGQSTIVERDNGNPISSTNSLDRILISPSPDIGRLDSPSQAQINAPDNLTMDNLLKAKEPLNKNCNDINLKNSLSKSATERVLPSISVLVVEDNAINQAILGAFLRKHKIHYEIAKNGQEAIDKWKRGGFHLVLMDIQLPVKSGIDATKEIRHLEKINRIGFFANKEYLNGSGKRAIKEEDKLDLNVFRSPVIIVALTASSNSSVDKKNALTAGCNDYLTKPVNLVWLQNKITEWGCMQALIDFDGWRVKESSPTTPHFSPEKTISSDSQNHKNKIAPAFNSQASVLSN
ncbi:uncharacterized protein PRCAT00001545001 [Priceomyces carsonii]|uniref:uncharacterized protein n=1 Tax=Priceomyces carsonii TaxID=28549 RepID=UPI002ED9CB36|nr:unnamed protein product [Priceomyces carsonii]